MLLWLFVMGKMPTQNFYWLLQLMAMGRFEVDLSDS
jgi:hypothetical protein